jgi:hypothetical protein
MVNSSRQDHDHHPSRNNPKLNETDQGRNDQYLIGKRIHDFPEIRHQIVFPGDMPSRASVADASMKIMGRYKNGRS